PTWSDIFTKYFDSGTDGACADCHNESSTAKGLYSWLSGRGEIKSLNSTQSSILTWFSSRGTMPRGGASSNPAATTDISAWAAAGYQNN
ncbi:MAG TPA: hypothetical protein VGI39_19525, partial [Polyangiaceae bacterium]